MKSNKWFRKNNLLKSHQKQSTKRMKSSQSLKDFILLLAEFPQKSLIIFLLTNFVAGLSILAYTNTLIYFLAHLVCLTLNMITTFVIGKKYALTLQFLDNVILNSCEHDNIELREIYKRFKDKAFSPLNLLFCVAILLIFFWGIFSQHYISLDLVGCYAVFIVAVTVSLSVIGYTQYMWLLWFIFRASRCSSMAYNKCVPAYTPFLIQIANLTKHGKWCFFIEGFLYVFEYYILIPSGSISINSINIPDKVSFAVTWCIILFVIILAFPIIALIQESLLSYIINNLKEHRIHVLSQQFEYLSLNNPNQISDICMCNTLISNLLDSPDYPVKIQRTGPAIVSLATFFLHIMTLLTQFPDLKSLFNL